MNVNQIRGAAEPTTLGVRNDDQRSHIERINTPAPGVPGNPLMRDPPQERPFMSDEQFAQIVALLTEIRDLQKAMIALATPPEPAKEPDWNEDSKSDPDPKAEPTE